MGTVALVPDDMESRGLYLGSRKLPDNYMEDFSLLGFIVEDLRRARDLLHGAGYELREGPGGIDILIHSPYCLSRIQEILAQNQVRCTLADIADTLYQA